MTVLMLLTNFKSLSSYSSKTFPSFHILKFGLLGRIGGAFMRQLFLTKRLEFTRLEVTANITMTASLS